MVLRSVISPPLKLISRCIPIFEPLPTTGSLSFQTRVRILFDKAPYFLEPFRHLAFDSGQFLFAKFFFVWPLLLDYVIFNFQFVTVTAHRNSRFIFHLEDAYHLL